MVKLQISIQFQSCLDQTEENNSLMCIIHAHQTQNFCSIAMVTEGLLLFSLNGKCYVISWHIHLFGSRAQRHCLYYEVLFDHNEIFCVTFDSCTALFLQSFYQFTCYILDLTMVLYINKKSIYTYLDPLCSVNMCMLYSIC